MNRDAKTCFKCGAEKPLQEFYAHKQMADGHLNKCKQCTKTDVKKNRNANAEYYLQYDRWRTQTDEKRKKKSKNKMADIKARKKWRSNNREKIKCHQAVRLALRAGDLAKPAACPRCKKTFPPQKIHAHHEDYSKPLQVKWLCFACHAKHHASDISGFVPKRAAQ